MLHAILRPRHPGRCWLQNLFNVSFTAFLLTLAAALATGQEGIVEGEEEAEEETEPQEEVTLSGRYVNLQPEFVLNYGDTDRLRFARLEVTIVGDSLEAAADINHHSPALRHIVVMTLTSASQSDIATTQGRRALRDQLRQEMRAFLEEEADAPLVSEVLFSNFIVN